MHRQEPQFCPGFQISVFDACFLVTGLLLSRGLRDAAPGVALIPGYVVGTFFLFCNVFRIARRSELLWTAFFVAAAGAATMDLVGWRAVFGGSAVLSVALFLVEFRKPSYHGIWWRHINPGLPEWWRKQQS
jgi:hypothetical protein